jgi:adenylate cyclase
MGEDELETVRTLEAYLDAVESAVEIQKELKAKNAESPENRRMEFRIGINLGDVIEEGERIYGDGVNVDGVNVAARIEGLAEAGGICISGTAFDQVEAKLGLEFEYLGEQSVKNIKKPVRVYRVKIESRLSDVEMSQEIPLPDKPSIAVLPFVNMSGDPEQEYFSDGITEEIITALSKVPKTFVIARNSTFTYKGKPVKVQQVGQELGVLYVLEGSVRKAGNRVRITAQLVDAVTGHHLWAERYDRELKDIFALQDEITLKILTALQVKLTEGEQARVWAKRTDNLEAFLKYLQARQYFGLFSKDGNILARQMAQEAIELDKKYCDPYVLLALTHWFDARLGWSESRADSLKQAYLLAQKAQTLDDSHPDVLMLLAGIHLYERLYEQAIAEGQRALALGPNNGELAMSYYYLGRYEAAIGLAKQFHDLADSRGEEYLLYWYYSMLAMNYVRLGRHQEAREAATEVLRGFPEYSLEWDRQFSVYKDPAHLERQHEDLRKAGIK